MDLQNIVDHLSEKIDYIKKGLAEINELTTTITKIAAPPFEEMERAKFVKEYFELLGYSSKIDEEGNVLAEKSSNTTPFVLSAHLDTVFDVTDIEIESDGDILRAPGIGDDSRGLANLLIIAKLLYKTEYADHILFVATVGEEGRGDLRGVKFLFSDKHHYDIKAFLTIDGTKTSRIVDQGIGSRRFRLYVTGPGGHSFGSFGSVNPLFALGEFMHKFSSMDVDRSHQSTFSLGVVGGGTSINAIPEEVWVDIDLRSAVDSELESMESQVVEFIEDACANENQKRTGKVRYNLEVVGMRPPGKLDADSPLRDAINEVHQHLGVETNYTASSTDANVPLNKGTPAISVAGVEKSGRAHTLDEWIDASENSLQPIVRNIILICYLTKISDRL